MRGETCEGFNKVSTLDARKLGHFSKADLSVLLLCCGIKRSFSPLFEVRVQL